MISFRRTNGLVLCFACVICLVLRQGCSSISVFDHYAYTQATSLKVDALALMSKATEDAAVHNESIDQLLVKVDKAYEYEKGRPKNEITTRMWEIIRDPDRNLLGGFIKRWREKGKLSKAFVEEAKGLVGEVFDIITGLESQKIKEDEASAGLAKFTK